MVDADRVRRLLVMLERYRSLLAVDDPDPYRRRHLIQTAAQISIDTELVRPFPRHFTFDSFKAY